MVFNCTKCAICQPKIKSYGCLFTGDRIRPKPTKVKDIAEMLLPMDIQHLQSLQGMINFMQAFVSHMTHHTTLLRDLCKKNVLAWMKLSIKPSSGLRPSWPKHSSQCCAISTTQNHICVKQMHSTEALVLASYKRGNLLDFCPSPSQTLVSTMPIWNKGCQQLCSLANGSILTSKARPLQQTMTTSC